MMPGKNIFSLKTTLYILSGAIAICSSLLAMLLLYDPHIGLLQRLPGIHQAGNFKNILPLVLTAAIAGCLHLLAIFYLLQNQSKAYSYAIAGGLFVFIWMISQMMILGYAHWLYLVFLMAGLLCFLIAFQLKGKWAV